MSTKYERIISTGIKHYPQETTVHLPVIPWMPPPVVCFIKLTWILSNALRVLLILLNYFKLNIWSGFLYHPSLYLLFIHCANTKKPELHGLFCESCKWLVLFMLDLLSWTFKVFLTFQHLMSFQTHTWDICFNYWGSWEYCPVWDNPSFYNKKSYVDLCP